MWKKKDVVLAFRVQKEVADDIKRIADEKGMKLSSLLNYLVVECIIKNNKKKDE